MLMQNTLADLNYACKTPSVIFTRSHEMTSREWLGKQATEMAATASYVCFLGQLLVI